MVFDLTKRNSFLKVREWLSEARGNGHDNLNFLLVGNKCDMKDDRQVLATEAQDLAFGEGFNYVETSALTAHNVEKAFFELTMRVLDKVNSGKMVVDGDGSNGVKAGNTGSRPVRTVVNLSSSLTEKESEGGCCGT